MRVALETYQSEGKHLTHMDQTLKSEGFYKKHTVRRGGVANGNYLVLKLIWFIMCLARLLEVQVH